MRVNKNPNWTEEQHNLFNEKLKGSGGYCPCRLLHTEENKCMCKEFRDQISDPNFYGECHCGRYIKEK